MVVGGAITKRKATANTVALVDVFLVMKLYNENC